jgi:hypothetical protein
MIDLTGVTHHKAMEDIVNILQNKTRNRDFGFFRPMTAYFLSKMAACMRATIVTKHMGEVPVNTYVINLAESGYGKGHSVSIMENMLMQGFQKRFVDDTMNTLAETALHVIAKERSDRTQGTTDPIDEDDMFDKVKTEFDNKGNYAFTFDSGSSPAVKQMRQKLIMGGVGAINLQMDEIGLNLTSNVELLTLLLELYDQGMVKDKLTKNTSESQRGVELIGKTPTNALLFGTPSKLFDGALTEDQFVAFLDTGYARRCLFGWGETDRVGHDLNPNQVYDNLVDPQNSALADFWAAHFTDLADPQRFNWRMEVERPVAVKLIEYQMACEKAALAMPSHEVIKKAEMTHRYFKALKLAGAYAFVDGSVFIEMQHLMQAILLVEESGELFNKMLNRERAYVKLAKYITSCGFEVTHVDLSEALPFYSRGNRVELMNMARAWGARNNRIIQTTYSDAVEFFKGSSLKETDLNKLVISYSRSFAFEYKPDYGPFDKLHKIMMKQDMNWCNHHFSQKHRSEDNVLEGFNMIALDVDEGIKLAVAMELMKEHKFFVYTTKRHHKPKDDGGTYGDRFRMVLPIKYNLFLDREDYKEFMNNIIAWLPFGIDETANQRSRKWTSHDSTGEEHGYHYYHHAGELLCPLKFIPKTVRNDEYKSQYKSIESLSSLERWFAARMVQGSRNNHLLRYAMTLVDSGMKLQAVEKAVYEFNDRLSDKLPRTEIASTIMKTVGSRYKGTP